MPGLLAFHAHPDDETISTGGTLAMLADRGVDASVVTATRGDVGMIHNRDDAEEIRPRLGEVREAEFVRSIEQAKPGNMGVSPVIDTSS